MTVGAQQKWDIRFKLPTAETVDDEEPEYVEQGFILYRVKGIPKARGGRSLSAQSEANLPGQDLHLEYRSARGGMGYSRMMDIPDIYDYSLPADTHSDPRTVLPPAKLEAVDLPISSGGFAHDCAFEGDYTVGTGVSTYFMCGEYLLMALFNRPPISIVGHLGTGWSPGGHSASKPNFLFDRTGVNKIWRLGGQASPLQQSTDTTGRFGKAVSMVFGGGQMLGSSGMGGRYMTAVIKIDASDGTFRWTVSDPMFTVNYFPAAPGVAAGPSHNQITGLISTPESFAVIKSDGVWKVDGTGKARHLTPYVDQDMDFTRNGICAMFYKGLILFSHARYLAIVPFTNERQEVPLHGQPGAGLPNENRINGQITTMTNVHGWINAWVYNEELNESYSMYGKFRDEIGVEGIGPIAWYGANQVVPGRVQNVFISSTAPSGDDIVPWLWIMGINGSTPFMYRHRIPAGGISPLKDPTYEFAERFWIAFPKDDGGVMHSATNKTSRRVDAFQTGDPDANWLNVSIGVDGEDAELQGLLMPPRDTRLTEQQDGTAFQTIVEGVGTSMRPAQMHSIVHHVINRPEKTQVAYYWFDLGATATRSNTGAMSTDYSKTLMAYLQDLEVRGDVILINEDGDEFTGKVEQNGDWTNEPAVDVEGWTRVFPIKFTAISNDWAYDDGQSYDTPGLFE